MARRNDLAKTWWSKQWISALETRALIDPNRLPRGRTYARKGYVLDQTIEGGEIQARVRGSRRTPYRVTIGVRRFRPEEWDTIFSVISSQVGFTADLLAGTVPPDLVADAARLGVELLPVAGDLQMNCSCPDWAIPCKHLAAVCYMTATALDADPFHIFTLRGRSQSQVEERLRQERSAAAAVDTPEEDPVELASSLEFDAPDHTELFSGIARGAAASPQPADMSRWRAVDPGERVIGDVLDAASRAALALTEGQTTYACLDSLPDLARRSVAATPIEQLKAAHQAGIRPQTLSALTTSWLAAGAEGVALGARLNGITPGGWPTVEPELASVVKQLLSDSGYVVRINRGWLAVIGLGLRLIPSTEPGSQGEAWFAVAAAGRGWEVVGSAMLADIADLCQ